MWKMLLFLQLFSHLSNIRGFRTFRYDKFRSLSIQSASVESSLSTTVSIVSVPSTEGKECKFVIYGEPVALARHRVTRFGSMYNPSSKQQKVFLQNSFPFLPKSPLEGPVEAIIGFHFSRPKNHYRSGKFSHILKPNLSVWYTKKPDLDNLVKFVLDSLNGNAYLDDSQIVSLTTKKLFTNEAPRVEIILRSLSEDHNINSDQIMDNGSEESLIQANSSAQNSNKIRSVP